MIDTHTHIYLPEFEDEPGSTCARTAVVQRALEAGVEKMIFPNIDSGSLTHLRDIHTLFPSVTYMAFGLHPTEVDEGWADVVESIFTSGGSDEIVAVGEVGIDLYWDSSRRHLQIPAFVRQLEIASERDLPVIIHQRSALEDVLEAVASLGSRAPRCVMHSFTGTVADVAAIRSAGDFYFGINGVFTFKNASELREAIHEIPTERLLLETDSPYLAPEPKRGRRNESSFLPYVAQRIAVELGMTVGEVEKITVDNTLRLFKII